MVQTGIVVSVTQKEIKSLNHAQMPNYRHFWRDADSQVKGRLKLFKGKIFGSRQFISLLITYFVGFQISAVPLMNEPQQRYFKAIVPMFQLPYFLKNLISS